VAGDDEAGEQMEVIVLDDRTNLGYAGAAELECPACHALTVYRAVTINGGRAIGLWIDSQPHQVTHAR
jgi:hypothetical protein